MNSLKDLARYAPYPISHAVLLSLLKEYKRPNDKIHDLLSKGILQSVKKGIYIVGPAASTTRPEATLIANYLWGPSYVSMDYALSYYALIPEKVFEVSSMTTKNAKIYDTPLGRFTYTHLPLPYYSFGICQLAFGTNGYALMASREKALCDKIISASGVSLRSTKEAYQFLAEDLRIDMNDLKMLDAEMIENWISDAPKGRSLSMLVKTIRG